MLIALSRFHSPKKTASSAKKRCEIGTFSLPTLRSLKSPWFTALLTARLRPSMIKVNRKGEIGSPCLRPRFIINSLNKHENKKNSINNKYKTDIPIGIPKFGREKSHLHLPFSSNHLSRPTHYNGYSVYDHLNGSPNKPVDAEGCKVEEIVR
ncbi:hypothetical protein LXL04_008924 [Taraxacum kok-saghyz]